MINPASALAGLPAGLRSELVDSYRSIVRNYIDRRWEPAELNGGKLAEVVYTIVNAAVKGGAFPAKASKPKNMADACRALENTPANPAFVGDKSLRVYIPRALVYVYDIRNQRGVGHVGGDVDPNAMDASAVLALCSWIMELVRIFHGVSTREAQDTVEALVERKTPLVWEVDPGGVKRVLDAKMQGRDQVLIFLHHSVGWVPVAALYEWVEQKNLKQFKEKVLLRLHQARLIEFDEVGERAKISPLGAADVEQRLLG